MRDNNSTWDSSGEHYLQPEWVQDPSRNNPISQTKGTRLSAKVIVMVEPIGVNFTLSSSGSQKYLTLNSTAQVSSGANQEVTVTANENLVDKVGIAAHYINWKITVGSIELSLGRSGQHKIYLTYSTPAGSEYITEFRLSEVCSMANGQSESKACADRIFDKHSTITYTPGAEMYGPSPIWLLHDPAEDSECPGVANFLSAHFEMLGLGGGTIRYCYAKADGTYEAKADPPPLMQYRDIVPGGTSGRDKYYSKERLAMIANNVVNKYEATVYLNEYYYALGVSRDKKTPKEVVKDAFSSNIEWQYVVGYDEEGNYKWVRSPVDPWVEKSP